MKAFIWTMAIYFISDVFLGVICLGKNFYPPKTRASVVAEVLVYGVFSLWAVYLIGSNS